jgi:hypothetical protein
MKTGIKIFLVVGYTAALVCAGFAVRSLLAGKTSVLFLAIAIVVALVSLAAQYVALAFWNPLKLFKKATGEAMNAEVTRAPWGN